MPFFKRRTDKPTSLLRKGWQLYYRPTTLEPIGTVFRIDPDGAKFLVVRLEIEEERGIEAAARVEQKLTTGAGALARMFGVAPIGAEVKGERTETVVFELTGTERIVTTDVAAEKVVQPFIKTMEYRADTHYFVIRECVVASAMIYRLTETKVAELGGEAVITQGLSAGASFKRLREGVFELDHTFPEPMRVMFLPEEIKPISAGLGGEGPELGLVPVKRPLVWHEPERGTS